MLEPGIYRGTFKSGEGYKTKRNKDQIVCVFDVTDIARKGQWNPIEQIERSVYLSLEGGAREYTRDKLESLGFNGNFGVSPLGFGKLGHQINLVCHHETYEGRLSDKWDLHEWGGSIERKLLSDAEKVQLNAWWQATAPKVAATETTASPPPPTDDDIPF